LWQKQLRNTSSQTSKTQVQYAPESHSSAVRVNAAMTPLQANNLAKDLRRLHWSIAGGGGVAPQEKGKSTAVSFLYIH